MLRRCSNESLLFQPGALTARRVHWKKWDAELRALISTCWNVDQSSRPNFHQIVPRLREFQQKEERLEAKRTKLKTYLRAMYP